MLLPVCVCVCVCVGGGGTPNNGLYGKAPPEKSTLSRLQAYERVKILQVEVYERTGKGPKTAFHACEKVEKTL